MIFTFASFRKAFCPNIDDKIEFIQTIITLHKRFVGDCSTCSHHVGSDVPGWMTDYGYCKKKCSHFPEKVCGLKKIECSDYEEDSLDKEYAELEKLKEKKNNLKEPNVTF